MSNFIELEALDALTGALIGPLTHAFDISMSAPLNDSASLTFKYAKNSPGYESLAKAGRVRVRINGEIPAKLPVFLVYEWDDDGDDDLEIVSYRCPSILQLLDKVTVFPEPSGTRQSKITDANGVLKTEQANLDYARKQLATATGAPSTASVSLMTYAPVQGGVGHVWVDVTNKTAPTPHRWNIPAGKKSKDGSWLAVASARPQALSYMATYDSVQNAKNSLNRVVNDKNINREFKSANPGNIMWTLITEANARDTVSRRLNVYGANGSGDALGAAWPASTRMDLSVRAGSSVLQVLDNLVEQGLCDYYLHQNNLYIVNADTSSVRRDLTLWRGSDISSSPSRGTYKDYADTLLLLGDDGFWTTQGDPAKPSPWGKFEESVSQAGVRDTATARSLGRKKLELGTQEKIEQTKTLFLNDRDKIPLLDYHPGDWIRVETDTGTDEVRVQQVIFSVDRDTGEAVASVVLNSRFVEASIRRAKSVKAISGGTSTSAGGTGGIVGAPLLQDTRRPSPPSWVSVEAYAYLTANRQTMAHFEFDWEHDSSATDNTFMGLAQFEIRYKTSDNFDFRPLMRAEEDVREAHYEPLPIYSTKSRTPLMYEFQIRAIGDTRYASDWSESITIEAPQDAEAPPVPWFTQDNCRVFLRTPTVSWDGRGFDGGAAVNMPGDLEYVTLFESLDEGVTSREVARFANASSWTGDPIPVGETRWYALSATDQSENVSDKTPWLSLTGVNNVDLASITDKVDGAKVGVFNINGSSISPNTITYNQVLASEEMWTKVLGSHKIYAGELNANQIWSDEAWLGTVYASKLKIGSVDGNGNRTEIDGTGLRQYGADGINLVSLGTSGAQRLSIRSTDGQFAASIDEDGGISGTSISADSMTLAGRDILAYVNDMSGAVKEWGYSRNSREVRSVVGGTPIGFMRIGATLMPGRLYRIASTPTNFVFSSPTARATVAIRIRSDGRDAMPDDSSISEYWIPHASHLATTGTAPGFAQMVYAKSEPAYFSFLMTVQSFEGEAWFANHAGNNPVQMWIEDIGPALGDTGEAIGSSWGASVPKRRQTATFWGGGGEPWGVYIGGNLTRSQNNDYWANQKAAPFGPHPVSKLSQRTIIRWGNDQTGGRSLTQTLSGAVIESFKVYVKVSSTYSATGVNLRIALLPPEAFVGPPDLYGGAYPNGYTVVTTTKVKRGEGRWVDLTAYAGAFKAGQYAGISIEGDHSAASYGTFVGPETRLSVTYLK